MGKVIMICGRIGSGKTTYAERLMKSGKFVNLSQDEIMLTLFGKDYYVEQNELYNLYCDRVTEYTQKKAAEIALAGANIIIENGFWSRSERNAYKEFYRSRGVSCELHYIDTSEPQRLLNIEKRNRKIEQEHLDFFVVQESDINHFFEVPDESEITVRVAFGATI